MEIITIYPRTFWNWWSQPQPMLFIWKNALFSGLQQATDDGRWRVRKRLDERRQWLLHGFNWSRRRMDALKAFWSTDVTKFPSLRICSMIHHTQSNTLGKWRSHRQEPFKVHLHRTPALMFKSCKHISQLKIMFVQSPQQPKRNMFKVLQLQHETIHPSICSFSSMLASCCIAIRSEQGSVGPILFEGSQTGPPDGVSPAEPVEHRDFWHHMVFDMA